MGAACQGRPCHEPPPAGAGAGEIKIRERKDHMLQWRELRADERESWYREKLQRDFPADELKPYARIEALVGQGVYHCCLFADGAGTEMAYAYWKDCGKFVLLDYLAVEPEARGKGVGSAALRILSEEIAAGRTMLIEAENPACAGSLAEQAARKARIRFYQKGGMRLSGVLEEAFGVEYRILTGGPEADDREVAQAMMDAYYQMVPADIVRREVKNWIP